MAESCQKRNDVNQNPKPLTDQQQRCIEKIRKSQAKSRSVDHHKKMKDQVKEEKKMKDQVKKEKKKEGGRKEAKLKKGKDYKSSEDRSVKEKDPKSVKIKYEATKPGGRGPRGEFCTQ